MLEMLLARRGIVVKRQLEFGTLEAIFGCVSAGLGITMLPRALVGGIWDAGRVRIHALPPEDASVETMFIRRRNGFPSSALRAFLACALADAPARA
jgi:DNA-binding transcriptional LysR family regulator